MTTLKFVPMPGGGAYGRSAKMEVRNPVLALPAARAIIDQVDPDTRRLLGTLLRQLAAQASIEAEKCWRRGKAMMGAYWRVVAVYAKHIAHAIDRRTP
jgi:hypothetical protein